MTAMSKAFETGQRDAGRRYLRILEFRVASEFLDDELQWGISGNREHKAELDWPADTTRTMVERSRTDYGVNLRSVRDQCGIRVLPKCESSLSTIGYRWPKGSPKAADRWPLNGKLKKWLEEVDWTISLADSSKQRRSASMAAIES